jgi:hypothetical protein
MNTVKKWVSISPDYLPDENNIINFAGNKSIYVVRGFLSGK